MNNIDLPPICGDEAGIKEIVNKKIDRKEFKSKSNLEYINSAFACALHMHQPTIPAGENGKLISHLQYMFENISEGDNHNAEPFAQCYKRLGEIIPSLIDEGYDPKIMIDYSGNLLWGIEQMGREDIYASLKLLTSDKTIYPHVEWLGTFWSHAVASSTPPSDFKLQITAWQHHFSKLFGEEALRRVNGFSLPEMHLPNHPEVLYQLIRAIKECGYHWIMVQEHSVQNLDGSNLRAEQKYIPNMLKAQNNNGETVSILALIKTQGSDTKLVGQMQPYYEALGLCKQRIGNKNIPSLVLQIADGENGGVMMNEFPKAFIQAYKNIGPKNNASPTIAMNGSEYLDFIKNSNISQEKYPVIQAVNQHKIWKKILGPITPTSTEKAITELKEEDQSFSLTGASWTNSLSWEDGYKNVLEPITKLSGYFHQTFDHLVKQDPLVTKNQRYQEALLYLLLLETSCFRYWGQGRWTEYAKSIYERGKKVLKSFEV
tara:strand:- start:1267 stop:2727 length:1461 start_codon:yes stop_codon:yes gene_type:complete